MEQHPVPQNIIDVEFKLFGSFTLKQFSKIIIGCLVGVVIYLLPIIPLLIKIPLILLSVAIGILIALNENFGVWLFGFIKSIFISPRYVWMKKESTPELLQAKGEKEVKKSQKVSSMKNEEKIDITKIPLDKLFSSKAEPEEYTELETPFESDPVRKSNLDRLYSQEFSGNIQQKALPQIQNQQQFQQTINKQQQTRPISIQDYQNEINKLKYELSRLNKDTNNKPKEQEILSRINDLYSEIKLINMNNQQYPQNHPIQSTIGRNSGMVVTPVVKTTKNVFGVIVDKRDNPISQASITFTNLEDNSTFQAVSSQDGRFSEQEIPIGKYNVSIQHPNYKFHTYQIDIKDQNLPAYKFRER